MNQPVPLGEICEFKYGKSLPASKRVVGGVSVYGSNGVVGEHNEGLTKSPAIVIGRKGSIGAISYSSASCWPIDTTYYVDETATSEDVRWLYHALKQLRLDELNKATGVPGLNRNDAYEQRLVRPPLDEQRRIAAILDKADAIRRKREQALALADDLLKSTFLEMFGDPLAPERHGNISTIDTECDLFAGNSLPRGEEFRGQDGGCLLLKVSDLNSEGNETQIVSSKLWVTPNEKLRASMVAPAGSIVFPKRGGAISTNKKRVLSRPAVLDPNLMGVAPKPGSSISFRYLRNWFELLDLVTISSGSTVPQLNKKDVGPLKIVVPTPADLERFDNIYERSAKLREKLRLAWDSSAHLFASLSQRAFRGEL